MLHHLIWQLGIKFSKAATSTMFLLRESHISLKGFASGVWKIYPDFPLLVWISYYALSCLYQPSVCHWWILNVLLESSYLRKRFLITAVGRVYEQYGHKLKDLLQICNYGVCSSPLYFPETKEKKTLLRQPCCVCAPTSIFETTDKLSCAVKYFIVIQPENLQVLFSRFFFLL